MRCYSTRCDVLGDELIRSTAFVLEKEAKKPTVTTTRTSAEGTTDVIVIVEDDDDDEEDDYEGDDLDDIAVEIEDIIIDELGNVVDDNMALNGTDGEEDSSDNKKKSSNKSGIKMKNINGNADASKTSSNLVEEKIVTP
eukprot:181141_1